MNTTPLLTNEYRSNIMKKYNLTLNQFNEIRNSAYYVRQANHARIMEYVFRSDEAKESRVEENFNYAKKAYEEWAPKFNELDADQKRVACAALHDLYDGYFEAMRTIGFEHWSGSNVVDMYLRMAAGSGSSKLRRFADKTDTVHHRFNFQIPLNWGDVQVKDEHIDPMSWHEYMTMCMKFNDEEKLRWKQLMDAVHIGWNLATATRWLEEFEKRYWRAAQEWEVEEYIPMKAAEKCEEKKQASIARKERKAAKQEMQKRESECKTIEKLRELHRPDIENWAKNKLGITDPKQLERVVNATLKKHYNTLPNQK